HPLDLLHAPAGEDTREPVTLLLLVAGLLHRDYQSAPSAQRTVGDRGARTVLRVEQRSGGKAGERADDLNLCLHHTLVTRLRDAGLLHHADHIAALVASENGEDASLGRKLGQAADLPQG